MAPRATRCWDETAPKNAPDDTAGVSIVGPPGGLKGVLAGALAPGPPEPSPQVSSSSSMSPSMRSVTLSDSRASTEQSLFSPMS